MQAWWAEETSLKNIKNATVQKLLTGTGNDQKRVKKCIMLRDPLTQIIIKKTIV